jgi:predicted DNA-binding transcriptional regulator AlpA
MGTKMRRSHKYKLPNTLTRAEIQSQLWLNIDEVLKIIPISRSKFWSMIDNDQFPLPYLFRGTPLWTRADIKKYIDETSDTYSSPKSKKPVTWDSILSLMRKVNGYGMTNKEIAHNLKADEVDVTQLTRLMWKAGVLTKFQPIREGAGSPNFYVFNENNVRDSA